MRIVQLSAFHAEIPLKRSIKHASYVRRKNDTLLIRAELDSGDVGWGEGLPREYVTGESISSCFKVLEQFDVAQLAENVGDLASAVELVRRLDWPAPPAGKRDAFGNSVRCAVELAVLDAVTRALGRPLSDVITVVPEADSLVEVGDVVQYSVAIPSIKPWKESISAGLYRAYGFNQFKVKVGVDGQDEVGSLRRVRRWAGRSADVRVDANEGWTTANLEQRVDALRPFNISSIEQPVSHRNIDRLRLIRPNLGIPIMFDESLCSRTDAERAIDLELCDLFNLRLSKCGGYIACLLLARQAQQANLGYQLGCMVGETGILTAAGRHFASSIKGIRHVEGSYDRYLVENSLTRNDLTFGRGGRAAALKGPGLGVEIDEGQVVRVACLRVELLSDSN